MRNTSTLFVFCVLSCLSLSFAATKYVWEQEKVNSTSAPLPRYHHAAAPVTNHSFAIFGGFDFGVNNTEADYLSDTWTYCLIAKTWTQYTATASPSKRAFFSGVSYQYELVIYGGVSSYTTYPSDVWRFNHTKGYWVQDVYTASKNVAAVLLQRLYHAAAVVGKIMYVFGGHTAFYDTTNSFLAYDLSSKNWDLLQPHNVNPKETGPSIRMGASLTYYADPLLGETLILFGGMNEKQLVEGYNDTWQYVITKNVWIQLNTTAAPPGRYGHQAVFINDTLFIYGGYASYLKPFPPTKPAYDVYFDDVWALKPAGKGVATWTKVVDGSAAGKRQGHVALKLYESMISVGGYVSGVGLLNDIWKFHASNTTSNSTM